MLDFFNQSDKNMHEFRNIWSPLLAQAETNMPQNIPMLEKRYARFFIQEWLNLYLSAPDSGKVGLAVFAYRVDIHRYAAGMLIDSNPENRILGIRILGYMRDESTWPILVGLLKHPDREVAVASLGALFQVNERRAREELQTLLAGSASFHPENVRSHLLPILGDNFNFDW